MRGLFLVVLIVAVAIGVLAFRQSATIEAQQGQLATMGLAVSAANEQIELASLNLQAKCSEQARKVFAERGLKTNDPAGDPAGYENHYNTKLKRCFIDIEYISATPGNGNGAIWTYRNVFDAFEGKEYGSFALHTVEGKKYWEIAPVMCSVTTPSGAKQSCNSYDEFSELVKLYMEG